jgi:hypothetical protein
MSADVKKLRNRFSRITKATSSRLHFGSLDRLGTKSPNVSDGGYQAGPKYLVLLMPLTVVCASSKSSPRVQLLTALPSLHISRSVNDPSVRMMEGQRRGSTVRPTSILLGFMWICLIWFVTHTWPALDGFYTRLIVAALTIFLFVWSIEFLRLLEDVIPRKILRVFILVLGAPCTILSSISGATGAKLSVLLTSSRKYKTIPRRGTYTYNN